MLLCVNCSSKSSLDFRVRLYQCCVSMSYYETLDSQRSSSIISWLPVKREAEWDQGSLPTSKEGFKIIGQCRALFNKIVVRSWDYQRWIERSAKKVSLPLGKGGALKWQYIPLKWFLFPATTNCLNTIKLSQPWPPLDSMKSTSINRSLIFLSLFSSRMQ